MSELSPQLAALVAASRAVGSPAPEVRERMAASLHRRLAMAASGAAALLVPKTLGAASSKLVGSGVLASGTAKVALVTVTVGATAAGVWSTQFVPSGPSPQPAAVAVQPVPATSASSRVEQRAQNAVDAVVPSAEPSPGFAAPTRQTAGFTPNKRDRLSEELGLLRDAQRALDQGDPARALAQLKDYRKRFPDGSLRHEADTAYILALCAAGRRDEGIRAAASFLSAQPESPFARRVRSACGTGSSEP